MNFDLTPLEKTDPLKLKFYVNKVVKIQILGGKSFEGVVFTVDPISECVVLICQENDTEIPMFFPKDSINEMTIIDSTDKLCVTKTELSLKLLESATLELSDDEKIKKRTFLKDLLLRACIHAYEDGDQLKIDQPFVVINPPYRLSDIVAESVVVLRKIQNLVKFLIERNDEDVDESS